MCGLTGFFGGRFSDSDRMRSMVTRMADTIAHRGPDDSGAWVDEKASIAFGFRRLSIIDLSTAGHQPMFSNNRRYVLAFNGEIYNHMQLRSELKTEGVEPRWHGHSDTETLLAGFEHWGIIKTLVKTVGMFSFVLWDNWEQTLHLARDRFGEKPLYYGWGGNGNKKAFLFGSELKALRAFEGFSNPVSREALAQYMRFMVVPAPRSIYEGIYKLEPGCLLSVRNAPPVACPPQPLRPDMIYENLSINRWWSFSDVVQKSSQLIINDEREAVETLEQTLIDAVRLQSQADVPLGAFLSGGVDSSIIVALMQQHNMNPVKTFTVGFEETQFDESHYAAAVAKSLGTNHTELFVTAQEAQAVIPQLPQIYDEPFADPSQIPTYLMCSAARQKVTVALSGDAGDELFGGYNRYFWGPRVWSKLARLPYPARQLLAATIRKLPIAFWDALGRQLNAISAGASGIIRAGEKVHNFANSLHGARNLNDLYLNLVSEWQDPARLILTEDNVMLVEPKSLLHDPLPKIDIFDDANSASRMMYFDSITYLPDDILCKVDRASMASSLETRAPFLDHRIAELAWRLPENMKIRGLEGKWALREVLYKYVPSDLVDRPKAGFAIPLGDWLRGPLRPWAESLLERNRLNSECYFDTELIRKIWDEHLSCRRDYTDSLWTVLMFQAWLQDK